MLLFWTLFFFVSMIAALLLGFGVLSGLPALAVRVVALYLLAVVLIGLFGLTVKPRT